MLTLNDRLSLQPNVLAQEMGGEMVVVLPDRAEFIVLNESGAYLLAQMQPDVSLGQLADDLAQHYSLSSEQAQSDILSWASELIDIEALGPAPILS